MNTNVTYPTKIVLLGDTGVGKTSISSRFVKNVYDPYAETTIGAAYLVKLHKRPNHTVKYEIWDTAGQERYRALVPLYYRTAHVALIVFDVGSTNSFNQAKIWMNRLKKEHPSCFLYLVGNKNDDNVRRMVTYDTGKTFADENNTLFMEVSAKLGTNIEELFNNISDKIPSLPPPKSMKHTSLYVDSKNSDEGYSFAKCCYG